MEFVSWDDDIPNIWGKKTCSKPPTSIIWDHLISSHHVSFRGNAGVSADLASFSQYFRALRGGAIHTLWENIPMGIIFYIPSMKWLYSTLDTWAVLKTLLRMCYNPMWLSRSFCSTYATTRLAFADAESIMLAFAERAKARVRFLLSRK